jgi:hypothetical protein
MTYPGRQQSLKLNIVVSSGSGTGTVTNQWDIIRRVRIVPINETDTYKCTIKDADGFIIFNSDATGASLTGTLSMLNEMSLGIVRTVNITNASVDGTYRVIFDMH